mmetsp:Transcript_25812/g.72286  ORF Transcript_25812/g.72286 Transcript_25812/m.72286 type:complete len:214 (-) Transcript_25812:122-763(-)
MSDEESTQTSEGTSASGSTSEISSSYDSSEETTESSSSGEEHSTSCDSSTGSSSDGSEEEEITECTEGSSTGREDVALRSIPERAVDDGEAQYQSGEVRETMQLYKKRIREMELFAEQLRSQLNRTVEAVVVLQQQREEDGRYIEKLTGELTEATGKPCAKRSTYMANTEEFVEIIPSLSRMDSDPADKKKRRKGLYKMKLSERLFKSKGNKA